MKKVPGHPVAQEIQVSTLWNRSASLGVESMRSRHENAPGSVFASTKNFGCQLWCQLISANVCTVRCPMTLFICVYIYIYKLYKYIHIISLPLLFFHFFLFLLFMHDNVAMPVASNSPSASLRFYHLAPLWNYVKLFSESTSLFIFHHISSSFSHHLKDSFKECTLPETKMAPENGWLEDEFPFEFCLFSGANS